MLLTGSFQVAALLDVAQTNLAAAFKSLNHGKQTKSLQPPKNRGNLGAGVDLTGLGRQTHNLEFVRGKRLMTRSHGLEAEISENPVPGTTIFFQKRFSCSFWQFVTLKKSSVNIIKR